MYSLTVHPLGSPAAGKSPRPCGKDGSGISRSRRPVFAIGQRLVPQIRAQHIQAKFQDFALVIGVRVCGLLHGQAMEDGLHQGRHGPGRHAPRGPALGDVAGETQRHAAAPLFVELGQLAPKILPVADLRQERVLQAAEFRRHGRLRQTRDDAALLHRHRTGGGDHVLLLVSKENPPDLRLEIGLVPHELFLQMVSRKFERHELMTIMCAARRRERLIGNGVIATIARQIIAPLAALCSYRSVPLEI